MFTPPSNLPPSILMKYTEVPNKYWVRVTLWGQHYSLFQVQLETPFSSNIGIVRQSSCDTFESKLAYPNEAWTNDPKGTWLLETIENDLSRETPCSTCCSSSHLLRSLVHSSYSTYGAPQGSIRLHPSSSAKKRSQRSRHRAPSQANSRSHGMPWHTYFPWIWDAHMST